MRIYSNYSDDDFKAIELQANEIGMTISSFQKYCVMLYIKSDLPTRNNTLSLPTLISDMMTELSKLKSGDTFIISSLFLPEVWSNLSTSEKRTLSSRLSSYVKANPLSYTLVSKKRGTINKYRKK